MFPYALKNIPLIFQVFPVNWILSPWPTSWPSFTFHLTFHCSYTRKRRLNPPESAFWRRWIPGALGGWWEGAESHVSPKTQSRQGWGTGATGAYRASFHSYFRYIEQCMARNGPNCCKGGSVASRGARILPRRGQLSKGPPQGSTDDKGPVAYFLISLI